MSVQFHSKCANKDWLKIIVGTVLIWLHFLDLAMNSRPFKSLLLHKTYNCTEENKLDGGIKNATF